MIDLAFAIFFASLLFVPVFWALFALRAGPLAEYVIPAMTFAVLVAISPETALWLLLLCVAAPGLMALGDRIGGRGAIVLAFAAISVAMLLASRALPAWLWIGASYFVLRHLHVVFDWWIGRLRNPGIARTLRYQFFLPLLLAGPINRFQHFERQCARRRWDASSFFSGAERTLFGAVMVLFIGGWVVLKADLALTRLVTDWPDFTAAWAASALDWIGLYFSFAGLNAMALGIALMLGLRLEENFNEPWKARNLLDFWSRWHMTLASWSKDYVFQPVTALTRSPVIGVIAAMLLIGVWHEVSAFYVLWGIWHATGIIGMRVLAPAYERGMGMVMDEMGIRRFGSVAGPVLVLGWLALARPAINAILGAGGL